VTKPLRSDDAAARSGPRVRSLAILGLKAIISIAIVWFLITKVDFETLSARLGTNAALPLVFGIVLGLLTMVVTAVRWWRIHHRLRADIPFRFAIPATMECYALNLALPGSVGGDIVRAARARQLCGRTREAVMAVLLDRGGNLAAQMVLCIAALPFLHNSMASNNLEVAVLSVTLIGALGVAAVYLAPLLVGRSKLERIRLIRELIRVGLILRRILHFPSAVCEIAVLSFGIQAIGVIILWTAVLAIGLETPPLFTLVVAMSFGMLGSALPISFGGLGVREGAVVWVFLETGMAEDTAFMIAIVFGALILSQTIPGLYIWAFGRMPPIISSTEN
jgi:glycosyltransferase 2 family protein